MASATMKCLIIILVGIAIVICGVIDSFRRLPDDNKAENTITKTPNASIVSINNAFLNLTAPAELSIHVHASNVSVEPIRWSLYSLQALGDKHTSTSHYSFEAFIKPNVYAVLCNASVYSLDGRLDGVDDAECKTPIGLGPYHNNSIPVTFHFAWRRVLDTLGDVGYLLVVKSNAPGVTHACPTFPYDTCWAQGLYWVPETYIKATDGGDRYTGPEMIHIDGTYCRARMEECVWSEYLY
ncbi:hypothetical protein Daus18300_010773 [Diaporthe australafricana]|uniref:Uncharacterized protein n=1 Tax=Diaporthe australafricana TaxID=127596 RepID=A0ABR3W997_9PEZI